MSDLDIIFKVNTKYNFDQDILSKTITAISSDDEMLGPGGKEHYYNVGLSAIDCIFKGINIAGRKINEINKILDFPCGYGRVLRFLKSFFPDSDIYACEIDEKYLDFCKNTFSVRTIISTKSFRNINLENKFDLIWCGSLFTHLNSIKFRKLLNFFYNQLSDSGLLVFSTHGRFAYNNIKNFDYGLRLHQKLWVKIKYNIFDFAYVNYLRHFGYGVSFSKPSWICSLIEKLPQLRLLASMEKAWDNHHDIIICKKENFL